MQFVNLRGDPINVAAAGTPKKKSGRATPDSYHKGWVVVGFSPEHLAEAERTHDPKDGKAFDVVSYMRTARPKAASRPYEIHSSALQHAEMLRAAGWQLVQVVAKAKGGKT